MCSFNDTSRNKWAFREFRTLWLRSTWREVYDLVNEYTNAMKPRNSLPVAVWTRCQLVKFILKNLDGQ